MNLNRLALAASLINLVALGALALLGGHVEAAPAAQPVLRAQLIELVDARGQVRAQLKTEDNGDVVLRLRDQAGNIRVKLGANALGSGLLLLDERTERGVQINSGKSSQDRSRDTKILLMEPGAQRELRPVSNGGG